MRKLGIIKSRAVQPSLEERDMQEGTIVRFRFQRKLEDLEPGDHLCSIYETEEEHRAVLTPFLRQGLERREKVLYITDAPTAESILDYLRDNGIDVEPYLASGQLAILTSDHAYTRGGVFDPDAMIALLGAETERALAEGYAALRVTGEMSWALQDLPGSERLIEYEAKLNEFFPDSKCLAMCQYDRRDFDPQVLLEVLRTHPIAVIGTEVCDNFYYIPPGELLDADVPAVELRRWMQNLAERKRAEDELHRSLKKLQRTLEGAAQALAATAEQRDPYTASHQRRVTELAWAIASEMGLAEKQVEGLRTAGLIHDLGKISVPAEILSKPSELTEAEMSLVKGHPRVAYDILKEIEFPWPVAQIVLQHHERLDGSGYPQGLSDEEILLEARILAVADVVEAMVSHRPYRPARAIDEALEEISQNSGTLYDPEVVDACVKLLTEKGFKFE